MLWDDTFIGLIGVVIGSLLTIIGNFSSQWFTERNRVQQWEREQKAAEERRDEEAKVQKYRETLEIYEKCLSKLSLIVTYRGRRDSISGAEAFLKIQEGALDWLSVLILHRSDLPSNEIQDLQTRISRFAKNPEPDAEQLLSEIRRLAATDPVLALQAPLEPHIEPNVRQVRVEVSEKIQRQRAIEGKFEPRAYTFECDLLTLTPSQREKLWNEDRREIPQVMSLSLPQYLPSQKRIYMGKAWKPNFDPASMPLIDVMNAWEHAYDEALKVAMQEQEQSRAATSTSTAEPNSRV